MVFTPANLDGQAGAQRLLGFKTYRSGWCLEAVWNAMNAPTSDAPGRYQDARNIWEYAPASRKHPGDRNVPAGAIVLFQNRANPSASGHIAISLGGNAVASTDKPSAGRTGVSSITEIEGSWGGRTYFGWTDWLGGHNIVNLGQIGSPVPTPSQPAGGSGSLSGLFYARGWAWSGVQEMLRALYGYTGRIDNDPGSNTQSGTWRAMQRFLKANWGYTGLIDGAPGAGTWAAVARWLRARYGYVGNDIPGPVMQAAFGRASAANGAAY